MNSKWQMLGPLEMVERLVRLTCPVGGTVINRRPIARKRRPIAVASSPGSVNLIHGVNDINVPLAGTARGRSPLETDLRRLSKSDDFPCADDLDDLNKTCGSIVDNLAEIVQLKKDCQKEE